MKAREEFQKKRKDNCPQKHNKLSCSSAQIKSEKYMYHNATGSHHQSTKMGGGGIKHATKVHDFAQRKTLLRLFNSKTRTKDEPHIHTYRQKNSQKQQQKRVENTLETVLFATGHEWSYRFEWTAKKGVGRATKENPRTTLRAVGGWKRKLQSGDATSYSKLSFWKLVIESVCFN